MKRTILLLTGALTLHACSPRPARSADNVPATQWVHEAAKRLEPQVIAWRRHIHQNPELGNQEFKTAEYVAQHLQKLGLEVATGVAKTGVVAVLKGGRKGKVVALRADMDALAVKEASNLPFASRAKGTYFGKEVDVAHMCGHDAHTAMLMGAAQVLAENRNKVLGQVVFIFQPAEEGAADIDVFAPNPPSWGAKRMLEEGSWKRIASRRSLACTSCRVPGRASSCTRKALL
jgi:amidohydrolase